jgi:hypothetical protein
MYNELNNIFPDHFYFYEVGNMSFGDALERCARLTGDDGHVVNYQGRIVFAVKHKLVTDDISWLNPVPGSPIEPAQNNG